MENAPPFPASSTAYAFRLLGDETGDSAFQLLGSAHLNHRVDAFGGVLGGECGELLKRFFREGENIRLQPSNATMKPIIVPAASVELQGRVIGVLRKY